MKLLLTALSVLVCVGLNTGVASAHVLKQNNGISGVLHMPPSDEPAANQPTKLGIIFADKTGAFSLQDCDCKVSITQDGKTIASGVPKPDLVGSTLNSATVLEFPAIGVYDVVATGSSKTGAFANFTLDYPVRVATDATNATLAASNASSRNSSGATPLILGIGSLSLLAIVGYSAIDRGGRYKPAPVSVKAKRVPKQSKK